jgi:hypothetical protein
MLLIALVFVLLVTNRCQQGWLYLEPIFGSDDIQQQMPNEGRKFKAVDATWRRLMERLAKQSEVSTEPDATSKCDCGVDPRVCEHLKQLLPEARNCAAVIE